MTNQEVWKIAVEVVQSKKKIEIKDNKKRKTRKNMSTLHM